MSEPLLLNLPAPIATPRLLLRPCQNGDGANIHPAKCESWAELLPWNIWTQKPLEELTVADDEAFCLCKQDQFRQGLGLTFLAFQKDKIQTAETFVGAGSLNECDWVQRHFTLGFWVRSRLVKQGYATEIGAALAHYAFAALRARKLVTYHADGNHGSRRVIEKLGFEFETIRPKAEQFHDGRYADHWVYGMMSPTNLPPLSIQ